MASQTMLAGRKFSITGTQNSHEVIKGNFSGATLKKGMWQFYHPKSSSSFFDTKAVLGDSNLGHAQTRDVTTWTNGTYW